jgi:aspartate aminotransferase
MRDILVESHVDRIVTPDNLKVGLMVAKQRQECKTGGCKFDYYGLGFGQSPFHIPPPLSNALAESANQGHYSDAEGIFELRKAIAEFNQRHFDLDVDPSRVIIGPGTKDLINTLFTMIKGGVILPSPSWIGYRPQMYLLDKHFHTLKLKPEYNYKIQPDDLDEFISSLSKDQHTLVLNNPHNPTGNVYSKEELEKIAEVCRKHELLVLADEIYALSTYDISKFVSMGKIYPEGTFITNGLSKDRSAGGYRLGSCILPTTSSKKLEEDFKKVAATIYTNVSTPTQFAAIKAYEPNEEIEEYFKITRQIHRIIGTKLSEEWNKVEGVKCTKPEGSFYFFADFNELSNDLKRKGVMNSNQLGDSLIECPYHLATVTGDANLLDPEDYGARIAFVDYNGKKAFEDYKQNPPKTKSDEDRFVEKHAHHMMDSAVALEKWVHHIKKSGEN